MRSLLFAPALLTAAAYAQPSFTPLGLPPQTPQAIGLSISDDGSVVVGSVDTFNPEQSEGAWVWRRSQGFLYLPYRAGDVAAGAFCVSGDGSRIVGLTDDYYMGTCFAASWSRAGVLTVLGDLPGGDDRAIAHAVSRNGSVVVGTGASDEAGSEAFRIGADGTMTGLGFINNEGWSEAYAVNSDGSVVVGMAYDSLIQFSAMWWSSEIGMINIGRLPDAFGAYAFAVSDDGNTVAGECLVYDEPRDNIFTHGFRWTPFGGMQELLPRPDPFLGSDAYCISADGSLIGGTLVDDLNHTHAMVWDESRGCRLLSTILQEAGLGQAIQGWDLDNVAAMSADGTYILGNGYTPAGYYMPFIVHLPRPAPTCSPDFNCDGDERTDADIEAFFACIAGDCPAPPCTNTADFNGDGDVATDADIESFFRVLAGGNC
jgi:uncharacterized membrane protein